MEDFVLQQESESTELLDIIHQVSAINDRHKANLQYAKLLKMKPELWMFAVIDKYPEIMDFQIAANDICIGWQYDNERKVYYDNLSYLKAVTKWNDDKQNCLFEGWCLEEDVNDIRDNILLSHDEQRILMHHIQSKGTFFAMSENINTLSDLVCYQPLLTENAINQIYNPTT